MTDLMPQLAACGLPDLTPALATLRRLQADMDQRYKFLAEHGRRSIEPGDPMVQLWVVVDVAAYHGATADPGSLAQLSALVRDIRTRGRAVGVRLLFPPGARLLPSGPRRSPKRGGLNTGPSGAGDRP